MVQTLVIETDEDICLKDGMGFLGRFTKRSLDILVSMVGMLLLSPVFLYIFIRIKCQNDGPVLFRQERIGKGGRAFSILKFRTMRADCDDTNAPQLVKRDDERMTPIGRFLRDYHLDELPQLWNVLVGDMSFVGYRPERKFFIDKIMAENPDYAKLYQIRPGITSMATIYNGYTDTMEKMLIRLQMDLEYLQKRSLWVDVKIVYTTMKFILVGKKI